MTKPSKQQIRRLREEFGLSRQKFGAITYATEHAVKAWEQGEHQMNTTYWETYLSYFGKIEACDDNRG